MNKLSIVLPSRLLLGLAVVLSVTACGSGGGSAPQIAYPPPFDYVDGQELRSRMHQLSYELQQLDLALMAEDEQRTDIQQTVISSLQDIERIGGLLREGDLSTTHVFLRDDMSRFLADVSSARSDAQRNPPRYYRAGRVSGACVNCHRAND